MPYKDKAKRADYMRHYREKKRFAKFFNNPNNYEYFDCQTCGAVKAVKKLKGYGVAQCSKCGKGVLFV